MYYWNEDKKRWEVTSRSKLGQKFWIAMVILFEIFPRWLEAMIWKGATTISLTIYDETEDEEEKRE